MRMIVMVTASVTANVTVSLIATSTLSATNRTNSQFQSRFSTIYDRDLGSPDWAVALRRRTGRGRSCAG